MRTEPQPLSATASGGKKIARITLNSDIFGVLYLFAVKVQFYCSQYKCLGVIHLLW